MRVRLFAVGFLLSAISLNSQESGKPSIAQITVLPSEPVKPTGNCKADLSGYLEMDGRTKMTKAEIGNWVDSSLRDGYVVTIYPETKRGIFVNMDCTNSMSLPTSHP